MTVQKENQKPFDSRTKFYSDKWLHKNYMHRKPDKYHSNSAMCATYGGKKYKTDCRQAILCIKLVPCVNKASLVA